MAELSSIVPFLLTIVEVDKCREDLKRILFSAKKVFVERSLIGFNE